MFAGLNVSPAAPPTTTTTLSPKSAEVPTSTKPAVTGSPSTSAADPAPAPTAGFALGGGDGGLFRGLDVSPSPRPASSGAPPPPPASPGIVLEPPPPPLDASAFSTRATTEPSSPRTETVFGNVSKTFRKCFGNVSLVLSLHFDISFENQYLSCFQPTFDRKHTL